MAISTFDGPVRSLNGFYSQGPGNVITLGATATLSVATHGGKILLVPATCAITSANYCCYGRCCWRWPRF
jgi:hypothetical protein